MNTRRRVASLIPKFFGTLLILSVLGAINSQGVPSPERLTGIMVSGGFALVVALLILQDGSRRLKELGWLGILMMFFLAFAVQG